MLVLTRKIGEEITIADDIVLSVKRIKRDRVVLAIRAPKTKQVLRSELRDQARPAVGRGLSIAGG